MPRARIPGPCRKRPKPRQPDFAFPGIQQKAARWRRFFCGGHFFRNRLKQDEIRFDHRPQRRCALSTPFVASSIATTGSGRCAFGKRCGRNKLSYFSDLPSLEHDLAARLAAFQKPMCAFQIGGVDGPETLVEGRAQHALVDQVGNIVEQAVLGDHVLGLKR